MRLAWWIALAGCGEPVGAWVDCVVKEGPIVECRIVETAGTKEIDVCWDVKYTCPDGATVTGARTCGKVKDHGASVVTIPTRSLVMTGHCDAKPAGAITNITIDGKPAELDRN
jgi:hypothetical protein